MEPVLLLCLIAGTLCTAYGWDGSSRDRKFPNQPS